jgi:hypothetical protein
VEQETQKVIRDEIELLKLENRIDGWSFVMQDHIDKLIEATQVEALKPNEVELAIARLMSMELRLILIKIKLHTKNPNGGGINPDVLSSLLSAMMNGEDE